MKYLSKKFKPREKDEVLLYLMSIIALVQIFYLVMQKKYMFIIAFFLIGVVLNFVIKNQAFILIIDVILVNILLIMKKKEGLENKETAKTVAAIPVTTEPPTKNKLHKKGTSGVSKNASSVTAPTTLKPKESFEGGNIGKKESNGQVGQVGEHIKSLGLLMDKFNGLTNQLGFTNKNNNI